MKIFHAIVLAVGACILVPSASAQFRKSDDAIKYRQSVMFTMGNHFYSRVGAMANGRAPFDPRAAVENTELIAALSRLPWVAFQPGTDGGNSDAKPAVWTEQAKFKDLGEKMQVEVIKLVAAAKTGDLENLKTAYRASANACKACHDAFTNQ